MSKTTAAYERLRREILRGTLAPDTPLTLQSLMASYEMGWTPLRDALSKLEGEGLVVLLPNRGYRVAGVSYDELQQLQQARLLIEGALLREAIAQGDEEWEKALLLAHHQLSRLPHPARGMTSVDYDAWEQAHQAFHLTLLSGAKNTWLKAAIAQIYAQVQRHQRAFIIFEHHPWEAQSTQDLAQRLDQATAPEPHAQLMQAALARDPEKAQRLLQDHIVSPSPKAADNRA